LPDLLKTKEVQANLFRKTNREAEAENIYRQVLAGLDALTWPNYPVLMQTLRDYGLLLEQIGRPEQAIELYQRAIETANGTLVPEHPDLVRIRERLSQLQTTLAVRVLPAGQDAPNGWHSLEHRRY